MDIVALSRDSVGLWYHYIFFTLVFSGPQSRDVGLLRSYASFLCAMMCAIWGAMPQNRNKLRNYIIIYFIII